MKKFIKSDDEKEGIELTEDKLDEINKASDLTGDDKMTKDDVVDAVQAIDNIADTILADEKDVLTPDELVKKVEEIASVDKDKDDEKDVDIPDEMVGSAVKIMVQEVPDGEEKECHNGEYLKDMTIDNVPSIVYDSDDMDEPSVSDAGVSDKDDGVLVIGSSASKKATYKNGYYTIVSTKCKKYIKQAYNKVQKLTSGKAMTKSLWALTSAIAVDLEKKAQIKSGNMKKLMSAYKKGVLKFQIESAKSCSQSKHLVRIVNNKKGEIKSAYANIVECLDSESMDNMNQLSDMLWGEGKKTFDEYILKNPERCDALFELLDETFEHQDVDGNDCATLSIITLNDLLWFDKETLVEYNVLPHEVIESLKKTIKSDAAIDPDGTTKVTPEKTEGTEVGFKDIKKVAPEELEDQKTNPEGAKPQTEQITKVEGDEEVTSSMRLWASMYCRRNRLDQSLARKIASAVAVYTRENKGRIESSMSKALRDDYAAKERERLFQSSSKAEKEAMVAEKQQIVSNVNTMSSLMARMF